MTLPLLIFVSQLADGLGYQHIHVWYEIARSDAKRLMACSVAGCIETKVVPA